MKKVSVGLILILLLLTACFGGGDEDTSTDKTTGFHSYATAEFRLNIPNEWEVLTPLNFTSDMPKNTVVAFRNNVKNPRFTTNVAISKNEISEEVPSLDYAKALHQKIAADLNSYKELVAEQTEVKVSDKPAATLFLFVEGRESPEADLKRFVITTGVKEKSAYTVVGAFLAGDEAVASTIETMVRSFEVK